MSKKSFFFLFDAVFLDFRSGFRESVAYTTFMWYNILEFQTSEVLL